MDKESFVGAFNEWYEKCPVLKDLYKLSLDMETADINDDIEDEVLPV